MAGTLALGELEGSVECWWSARNGVVDWSRVMDVVAMGGVVVGRRAHDVDVGEVHHLARDSIVLIEYGGPLVRSAN